MKRLVVGILAHVDAGKTTLSEAMLYTSGQLRKLGRVDHGDAFLDTDVQERERGITIFSKQALLNLGELEITLLDTPGHVDFSAEMERTLQVMDCAIMVISGSAGVQSHTRTLWRLLARHQIPTFFFINKMDLAETSRPALLEQLQRRLGGTFVDFSGDPAERDEAAAVCDEDSLEEFLETGTLSRKRIAGLISTMQLTPCWFGSALKLEGIQAFLQGLVDYAPSPSYPAGFGAKVFKISRDSKNTRLTWLKITGGALRTKMSLSDGEGEGRWEEKTDQLRLYSGAKFQCTDEALPGQVVAVTGLTKTRPGMGLGQEPDGDEATLEPVLSYRLLLPEGADPHTVLPKLRLLEEEDPMLRVLWSERWGEIHLQLMGQVQLEVLRRLIADRFDLEVDFGAGSIVYKETIADTVEGVGHFEPLRHYAEVHLLLEPGERGSGLQVSSRCTTDHLDLNWQRLIITHLLERDHPGVLTGSAITDMKITLVAGRAHLKHTEGGDFRQATYRAVRQGLMQAEPVLLEPFYDFRLELPHDCVGRAMTDLQGMGGVLEPPMIEEDVTLLTGFAPVAGLRDYWKEVTAYSRGLGRLSCAFRGYEPCHDQEAVAEAIGYDPERDVDNPADSVFCEHGGGFTVKWDQVFRHMHIERFLQPPSSATGEISAGGFRKTTGVEAAAQEKELQAIFERTYGKTERQAFQPRPTPARTGLSDKYENMKGAQAGPEYLLVDGYNIIFAWDELKNLARQDIAAARGVLADILANYRGFRKCEVILVFDAYKVKDNPGSMEKKDGIYIVYTKEAETADTYIERTTYQLARNHRVRVATSDGLEQVIILGHGAHRLSAESFKTEVEETRGEISHIIADLNRRGREAQKLRHTARIIEN